jgi:hypothetical protein
MSRLRGGMDRLHEISPINHFTPRATWNAEGDDAP